MNVNGKVVSHMQQSKAVLDGDFELISRSFVKDANEAILKRQEKKMKEQMLQSVKKSKYSLEVSMAIEKSNLRELKSNLIAIYEARARDESKFHTNFKVLLFDQNGKAVLVCDELKH